MPRATSTPSLSKAPRIRGLDISRAKKRVLAKLKKDMAIERNLKRMGNVELLERIQFLRHRPLVKFALTDPVDQAAEFRRGLLNEYKSLLAQDDLADEKGCVHTSKRKKRKGFPLVITSRPRIRSRRK